MWKKDVLIGATACLTGCDSVSYHRGFTVSWKKEHERPRDYALKPEYEGIFARRGEYLFSCSGELNRLVFSVHQGSPNYMRD
jgi:hypothetical protein